MFLFMHTTSELSAPICFVSPTLFFPNKEIPKNNCCDNNSFTTRLIISRKVSFKLPVFQSILEMLVFYYSENTGLVSIGYSEQI